MSTDFHCNFFAYSEYMTVAKKKQLHKGVPILKKER
jgi:hypothetical protein